MAKTFGGDANRVRRAIFARCRELGIGTADRHAIQLRATGRESLTEMAVKDMVAVLRALDGWGPRKDGARHVLRGPHAGKLRALWISGYWLGAVRDRSDAALGAWVRRQAGIDSERWATPAQTARCVEGLKGWLAREAGVDWSPYAIGGRVADNPGARVLEALWRSLAEAEGGDAADDGWDLANWVTTERDDDTHYAALDSAALARLHRVLGEWLRRAKAGP